MAKYFKAVSNNGNVALRSTESNYRYAVVYPNQDRKFVGATFHARAELARKAAGSDYRVEVVATEEITSAEYRALKAEAAAEQSKIRAALAVEFGLKYPQIKAVLDSQDPSTVFYVSTYSDGSTAWSETLGSVSAQIAEHGSVTNTFTIERLVKFAETGEVQTNR